jgi:hypothetical protein
MSTQTEHLSNVYDAALAKGWTVEQVCHLKGGGAYVSGAVTLCSVRDGEWAVHCFNKLDGGFYFGDYFTDPDLAFRRWIERVERV